MYRMKGLSIVDQSGLSLEDKDSQRKRKRTIEKLTQHVASQQFQNAIQLKIH